jgi:hypothetical protein
MRKITFAEKNSLIVKHHGKEYFYKDLELFKKHLPSHELNTELANANRFSIERLDGQMLNELLNIIGIDEILDNRQVKKPEPTPEPLEVKTIDDVKAFLIAEFALTDKDFEIIGEDYLQFLTTKDDETIKTAIQKFAVLRHETEDEDDDDDNYSDGDNGDDGDNNNATSADATLINAVNTPIGTTEGKYPATSDKKKEVKARNSRK